MPTTGECVVCAHSHAHICVRHAHCHCHCHTHTSLINNVRATLHMMKAKTHNTSTAYTAGPDESYTPRGVDENFEQKEEGRRTHSPSSQPLSSLFELPRLLSRKVCGCDVCSLAKQFLLCVIILTPVLCSHSVPIRTWTAPQGNLARCHPVPLRRHACRAQSKTGEWACVLRMCVFVLTHILAGGVFAVSSPM